jgi:hypothetical protein
MEFELPQAHEASSNMKCVLQCIMQHILHPRLHFASPLGTCFLACARARVYVWVCENTNISLFGCLPYKCCATSDKVNCEDDTAIPLTHPSSLEVPTKVPAFLWTNSFETDKKLCDISPRRKQRNRVLAHYLSNF